MRRRLGVMGLIVVMAGTVARGQSPARDNAWVAPMETATALNPLANRPEARPGGRKLFLQRCAACHGPEGRGSSKGPDLGHPRTQEQSDGALFWKMSTGNSRDGMPAFSLLPELQRWQILLHLRTLSVRDGAAP